MDAHIELADAPLWAKTSRTMDDARFHPLICHLIDVAVVARALWDKVLPAAARRHIGRALDLDEDAARALIAYLAGLHDIGKACPSFQIQHSPARAWLRAAGFPVDGFPENADAPHGTLSAVILSSLLSERHGFARIGATTLATAVGGHHGIFPADRDQQELSRRIGAGPWNAARERLVDGLAVVVDLSAVSRPSNPTSATSMWIAGLVSVADWIGSNSDFFPFEGDGREPYRVTDLAAYATKARQRAGGALDRLGWLAWTSDQDARDFQEMFPFPPNALQRASIQLAPKIDGAGLAIIEAPMGLGKTEVALYLMDFWAAVNGQRGAYIALPTMATSNQMFSRVREFLDKRYPGAITNLQLLHGQTALSQEFNQLLDARRFVPDTVGGGAEGGVIAAEWFTYRKRGLLAPFGVGTVDQSLLAVLQTRHVFVRLFGLANKTLIVDEVHAYDTYMTSLLERLLEWCAALGSSVILLSATLPDNKRRSLAAAYARGIGDGALGRLPEAKYPRLSWVSQSGGGAQTVELPRQDDKSIHIAWLDGALPQTDHEAFLLAEFLSQKVGENGGCAAVICNTVRRAQQVYRELQRSFGPDELGLLHARYLFNDRDEREKRALQRFGKPGSEVVMPDGSKQPVDRPARFVLIATQVIEQSLDLDFDLMVSDFAPIDLLLQRAGRLHRHQRGGRPGGLERPELWVVKPIPDAEGRPQFEGGTKAVYDEHVLLRTWLALQERQQVRLPNDVEPLIEAVYSEREAPADLSAALSEMWRATRDSLDQQVTKEEREAQNRRLREPSYAAPLWQFIQHPREEDAPDIHSAHQAKTRLADLSVQIVCLYGTEEQSFLDTARLEPISYRDITDNGYVRELLMRSVSLSDRRVVHDVFRQKSPAAWRRSPLLRHHRLILLDDEGRSPIGEKFLLTLDAELGVVVSER